jgi:hypothetical protein
VLPLAGRAGDLAAFENEPDHLQGSFDGTSRASDLLFPRVAGQLVICTRLPCPSKTFLNAAPCGGELLLMNVIPPFGERPEILTLRCVDCDRAEFLTLIGEGYRTWPADR